MADPNSSSPSPDSPAEPASPTFGAALAELEAILRRIEGDQVDIDLLAAELRRAAVLLELCRGKVRRAETEVNEILTRFGAAGDEMPAR